MMVADRLQVQETRGVMDAAIPTLRWLTFAGQQVTDRLLLSVKLRRTYEYRHDRTIHDTAICYPRPTPKGSMSFSGLASGSTFAGCGLSSIVKDSRLTGACAVEATGEGAIEDAEVDGAT